MTWLAALLVEEDRRSMKSGGIINQLISQSVKQSTLETNSCLVINTPLTIIVALTTSSCILLFFYLFIYQATVGSFNQDFGYRQWRGGTPRDHLRPASVHHAG